MLADTLSRAYLPTTESSSPFEDSELEQVHLVDGLAATTDQLTEILTAAAQELYTLLDYITNNGWPCSIKVLDSAKPY